MPPVWWALALSAHTNVQHHGSGSIPQPAAACDDSASPAYFKFFPHDPSFSAFSSPFSSLESSYDIVNSVSTWMTLTP